MGRRGVVEWGFDQKTVRLCRFLGGGVAVLGGFSSMVTSMTVVLLMWQLMPSLLISSSASTI